LQTCRFVKRVSISATNDLVTDQRVQRMIHTLRKDGIEVVLRGRKLRQSPPMPSTSYSYRRYRMLFSRGFLFYAFFNVRVFLALLFSRRPDLLIPVDLDTLPANYLAGGVRRIPILYDSHEFFTGLPELVHRPAIKKFWEFLERKIVPRLQHAITVSPSIASAYASRYGISFSVIRNVPFRKDPVYDPEFADRYPARNRIIYQGALNMGRGLEILIDSMEWISDTILFIAGDGDIRETLRLRVMEKELNSRVVFTGRYPPGALHRLTSQCHLGVSLEEDLGLNYRMALPNKLFDYIQARVPVLCSDLPEMRRVVEEYEVGEVVRSRDARELASQMRGMLNDRDCRLKWKQGLDVAAGDLCWEKEEQLFREAVVEACSGCGSQGGRSG